MFQDSWTTGWTAQLKEDDWEDEYMSDEFHQEVICYNNMQEFAIKIDVPDWANIEKDYKPVNAERIGNTKGDFAVVVTYSPNVTLGIGYKRVFIVEKSTQKPFPRMKEMWDELRNRIQERAKNKDAISSNLNSSYVINVPYANIGYPKGYGIPDNITIYDNGELRSAFGVPKTMEICGIVFELSSIYNDWRLFPNETKYSDIEMLKDAKYRVRNMQRHAARFESEINESRSIIKEQQDRISNLEEKMNKIYEEGADAMNLLEEHGVKFNLNGEIQRESCPEDVAGVMIPLMANLGSDLITIPYDPGALITCDKSQDNSILYKSGY